MTVTYFLTGVGEFIHYLMLKTGVDKTERMSVKFKDSLLHKDKFTEKKM